MKEKNRYGRSIELLNTALDNEIAASLQYVYFHVHCEDRGYRPLARFFKRASIEEMKHIEEIAERVLYLGGDISMNTSFETKQVADVTEMLKLALQLEQMTVDRYNAWAKECADLKDAVTYKLFRDLLIQEEKHLDHFRTELDNMRKYGNEYLMLQSADNIRHITETD